MQNLEKKQILDFSSSLRQKALDFINIGVGCNCLVILSEEDILDRLLNGEIINEKHLAFYKNSNCLKSALVTLEKCSVLSGNINGFSITELGKALAEYIGLITIFFSGYGGLIAQQADIIKSSYPSPCNLVKWPVVAKSSIHISETAIDPILIEEVKKTNLLGTICDLGCGQGVMLSKICQASKNPGLGFESNERTVFEARKKLLNTNVSIEIADISNLNGIWKEVVILMQAFVFHDFTPEKRCVEILDSYLENFPNLNCFFYVDIVSPSESHKELFPGFDYVHGLLGIPTRTYEETLQMFALTKYSVAQEIAIPNLPNTFLWVLVPNHRMRVG